MSDPRVTDVDRTDRREVNVRLRTAELLDLGTDKQGRASQFQPDHLRLQWVNGELAAAWLTGRRIRANGKPYADMSRTGQSLMASMESAKKPDGQWSSWTPNELADDAPEWVRALVKEHAP